MRLDRRTVHAGILIALSLFFAWMWASQETLRYLGPRTSWLVPFGAIGLGLLALGAVQAARRDPDPAPLGVREAAGLLALVLPMVMAFLLAHTQLGAQAASKKLASRGIDSSALSQLAAGHAGELDFLALSVAQKDRKFAAENGVTAGKDVRLLGFVSATPANAHAPFQLTRFYITCCVADSVPIGVTVLPAAGRHGPVRKDQWLDVTGDLERRHGRLVVHAVRARAVPAPKHPYLYVAS